MIPQDKLDERYEQRRREIFGEELEPWFDGFNWSAWDAPLDRFWLARPELSRLLGMLDDAKAAVVCVWLATHCPSWGQWHSAKGRSRVL